MDHNRTAANPLIETIVVDIGLDTTDFILFPDSNAESVRIIAGPEHETIVTLSVNSARSLELGVGTVLIDNQPIVAAAVEIQLCCLELELSIAGRCGGALLVFRDEPEVGFAPDGIDLPVNSDRG